MLDAGLQKCAQRLPDAQLQEQLLCLRRLREAGPAASAAIPRLSYILTYSDGSTNHNLVAAVLDVFRSLGAHAAPAAETLSSLLPHRSKLYRDRDQGLIVRLRAYIMLTLSDIGVPPSALPLLLDTLAHVDERMSPLEVGAAARAVRSLGPRGRAFAPYLIHVIFKTFSEEEFSLGRYASRFPPDEATTVQLEAVRCLGRISIANDKEVLTALRQIADDSERGELDPRIVREAQTALDRIMAVPVGGIPRKRGDRLSGTRLKFPVFGERQ